MSQGIGCNVGIFLRCAMPRPKEAARGMAADITRGMVPAELLSVANLTVPAHAPRTDNKLAVLSGFVVAPGQLHSRCPVASKQLPIGPFQDNYPAVPASTASTLPGFAGGSLCDPWERRSPDVSTMVTGPVARPGEKRDRCAR